MWLPEEANLWKSDGRTIELDLNDPSIAQSDTPGKKPTALRFAEWLRSNGWTVSTEHGGPLQIGGRLRSRKSLWQTWSYWSWMSLPIQIACN